MQFKIAFIRSKVARRVIWLFIISILVPITVTAIYSFTYVNNLLVGQSYRQLQHTSKLYGMAVLDRLIFVDSKLREQASTLDVSSQDIDKLLSEQRKTIGNWKNFEKQINKISLEVVPSASIQGGNDDNKSILYSETSPEGVSSVYLGRIIATYKNNKTILLAAQLKNNYLWGEVGSLPFSTHLCIIDDTGKMLFCPNPDHDALLNKIRESLGKTNSRRLTWDNSDGKNLAIAWDLFIKSNFSGADWKIISSWPESDALSPVYAFHKIFPLVILLSLFVVLFLSLIQVKRIMLPLERLVNATRRLARYEFGEPVCVNSNDEFGELGDSFNTMAVRLEKQFSILRILSDIDHLILSFPDPEVVLAKILDTAHKILSCDYIVVTLIDEAESITGWTYIKEMSGNKPAYMERAEIPNQEFAILQVQQDVQLLDLQKQKLICLEPVIKLGVATAQVCPILLDGSVRAIFSLGYNVGRTGDFEDTSLVRDIIDRLAVALATADRDEKLYRQAHFDFLTGLPNRQLFNDRLEQHIIRVRRENEKAALLYIDLDRFKNINDSLGHASGDLLLRKVAERMKYCVRESDTVSRLGGDEFVILLSNVTSPADVRNIAENIINVISRPYIINGREIFVNASVGIVVYPEDGKDNKELLAHADAAMYHAKASGRGRIMFFEESMNREIVQRIEMETAMRHAIDRKEFHLCYQPQIDLRSGKVMAIEALIRWNHPVLGIVKPTDFIPLAEECGLIEPIGEWVLQTACMQYRELQSKGIAPSRLAVNISSRQFMRGNLIEVVDRAINMTKLQPNDLELEITESLLLDESVNTRSMFEKLGSMGVQLAIDDFGTGYSSLGYLKRFPVHTLKIDRAFTRDIPEDKQATTLTLSIIAMAHALKMQVVAEGVESKEQLELLRKNHCDYVQGNYFSLPLSIEELVRYLDRQGAVSASGV